jgi:hypothetical protein
MYFSVPALKYDYFHVYGECYFQQVVTLWLRSSLFLAAVVLLDFIEFTEFIELA